MKKLIFAYIIFVANVYCTVQAIVAWSEIASIPGSQSAVHTAVARDAQGNAIIAWITYDGRNRTVKTAYYTAATKAYSSTKTLGTAHEQSNVYVSMNTQGHAIIAWIDANQIVTTVEYSKENWQTWPHLITQHSRPSDEATDLYIPQSFYSYAYLAWTTNTGTYTAIYETATDMWTDQKIITNETTCHTISVATDALDNVLYSWLVTDTQDKNKAYATRYDMSQTWSSWTPCITAIGQSDNVLCLDVAASTVAAQAGTAIFFWLDAQQGLQATLYNPTTPWQTWDPATNLKTISSSALPYALTAMDSANNALFAWQTTAGHCVATQYNAQEESWQTWSPQEVRLIENRTLVSDIRLIDAEDGIVLLSSIETSRLNTLYCVFVGRQASVLSTKTIPYACTSTSEKMAAFRQNLSICSALIAWPNTPSKGVQDLFVIAQ